LRYIVTIMKKYTLGFNLIFALMAFPVGLGLLREYKAGNGSFENKPLAALYFVVFIASIILMLLKKKQQVE
jgi:hypothetical protein